MSELTASIVGGGSEGSSATLRDFAAASNEVHMLATLTAAMMEAQKTSTPYVPSGRLDDDSRRSGSVVSTSDTLRTSPRASAGGSEPVGEHARRRRSTSRSRTRPSGVSSISATAGALMERMRSSGQQQSSPRSGNTAPAGNVRAGQRLLLVDTHAAGAAPSGMTTLRRHVEELSAQLKLARAKQETDAKAVKELKEENARLKQVVESASEVSDAAATSLRELARSRRTVDDLRQEADGLQRRAQEAELRCEQLQQQLRESEARMGELEQRAASVRAVQAERARAEQALEAANERVQNAERRAARAEQVANQEQSRAADACQRASRAEAAAAEDHDRALDAERRAARAEHLLEQLQAQVLELERQVARAEQAAEAEAGRTADAERRAARGEQLVAQERERVAGAERRAARAEDEAEQARAFAVAADRRAALAEEALGEERARTEAAERRAARAEQAAEESHQLVLEAERRVGRATQLQEEAERRAARVEQAQEELAVRAEEAERRAARAGQAQEATEARLHEAERRAARAEQAQQEQSARAAESERQAARAEQTREEALASLSEAERRIARAEQAAEEARAHANEAEKRVARSELAAQQDKQRVADAERHIARTQQALEQAQAEALAAERRTARAEQVAEEARARTEEARNQAAQADTRAARADQALAQERERVQEEARHAARMETAAQQDQERAREAEDRAAAAIARAQQAETRLAVAEGHNAALEVRLQQALSYADAADARAVDAERRYDRLAADSRELHAVVVQFASNPDPAPSPQLRSRVTLPQDRDRSPHRLQWYVPSANGLDTARRAPEDEVLDTHRDLASPRRGHVDAEGAIRSGRRTEGATDIDAASSAASTPGLAGAVSIGTRVRIWADAYATPPPEPESGGSRAHRAFDDRNAARVGYLSRSVDVTRSNDGARPTVTPGRSAQVLQDNSPGSSTALAALDQAVDPALVDELRHLRAELRSARHELGDLKHRYSAACTRVQQLEEQATNSDQLKVKVEKLAVQARKSEHLAAEVRVCRTQLAEVEGLQLELRKAQAELMEAQGLRTALEEARAQLVEMDRVRSEFRRVNASLQTVVRERDTARNELAEASAQLVSLAALRAQLQRAEAATADAEQAREEARAAAAAAAAQQEKLRSQLCTAEEEMAEAVRRCARLQAAAEEAAHQRDRLQAALGGAEGALQAAEEERAVLAAEQDRLKGKVHELNEAQEEIRTLKSQLQEVVTNQRRIAHAEEQARLRAEEAQRQVTALKAQLAEAITAQADAAVLQQQLKVAQGQLQTMKDELNAAADRLQGLAKLQAAQVERAEKAEAQARSANDETARTKEDLARTEEELAESRRDLAKNKEEMATATALASSRGNRVAELDHDVAVLREKSYQLEVEVAGMTTELHRLKADLASASDMIDEANNARNQLSQQLNAATQQTARGAAAASAAEERLKADMQQLQVRLAASEAECRALQHANGTLHDEMERAQGEKLSLQGQLQDESRHKEELAGDCRRLQRELEAATEGLANAQRAQRTAAAGAVELDGEVERLRTARNGLEAELQAAIARIQRLQEDVRQLSDQNAELTNQLHAMSSTVRQLEAENARLADGHATLIVEAEVRAAEVRAARGEAVELAADRARLMAELQALKAEAGRAEAGKAELLARMSAVSGEASRSRSDPRITITGGGIPPVADPVGHEDSMRRLSVSRQLNEDFASVVASPNAGPSKLQALLDTPLDTGALMSGGGDLSQYEALLAALDEEAQQLDEELAGKEASNSVLLQRMRATKEAITARMDALQTALQSAREAETDMRRQAADKEVTILMLQQQLAQLAGAASLTGGVEGADTDAAAGQGGAALPLGYGTDVLQGNVVISALRQDLDAAHERLRDAGRQLREAQQRAETAEAEVGRAKQALTESQSEAVRLQAELAANDRVLADAESALVTLVADKEALEQRVGAARAAERAALQAAEGMRTQVSSLQSQLEAALEASVSVATLEAEPSGGMTGRVYDRMINYLQSLNADGAGVQPSEGGTDLLAAPDATGTPGGAAPPHQELKRAVFGVRAAFAAAPALGARLARRYQVGLVTSESCSTVSAVRPSGGNADLWEAFSASGWDDSAGASVGGTAAAVPNVQLFLAKADGKDPGGPGPSAQAAAAQAKAEPDSGREASVGEPQAGCPGDDSAVRDGGAAMDAAPAVNNAAMLSLLRRVASETGPTNKLVVDTSGDGEGEIGTDGASSTTPSVRGELVRSPSATSAAGLVMRARASAANTSRSVSVTGAGGAVSPAGTLSPASARSRSLTGEQAALDHAVGNTRQSLERLIGEVGARSPGSLPSSARQSFSAAAPPQLGATADAGSAGTASAAATPRAGKSGAAHAAASDTAPSVPAGTPATPAAASPATSALLLSSQSFPARSPLFAASRAARPSAAAAAATPSPFMPNRILPRTPARPNLTPATTGRLPAVADAGAALKSASYRLLPVMSPAPLRVVTEAEQASSTGKNGQGSDPERRSVSFGGSGAAASSMISPRSTLEGRSLSRAVHRVASVLSSPLRTVASVSPSSSGRVGEVESAATTAQPSTTSPSETAPLVPTSKSLPILHALAQGASQQAFMQPSPSVVLQPTGVMPSPQPLSTTAFSSHSASDIAAVAAASSTAAAASGSPGLGASEASLSFSQRIGGVSERSPDFSGWDRPQEPSVFRAPTPASTTSHQPLSTLQASPSRPPAGSGAAQDARMQPLLPRGLQATGSNAMTSGPQPANAGRLSLASTPNRVERGQEGGSLLAQRLAAMDEALRAIGAV